MALGPTGKMPVPLHNATGSEAGEKGVAAVAAATYTVALDL